MFEFLIDNDDVNNISQYQWSLFKVPRKDSWTPQYYASTCNKSIPSTNRLLHRFIMDAVIGMEIDHIDGNDFDTRKQNLRECTKEQNSKNRDKQSNNTSGHKGVRWADKILNPKWHAFIKCNDKFHSLGYYNNIEDAIEARRLGELEYQGEFSRLNQ